MEAPFSPTLKKIAGKVVASSKRSFSRPTEICLEEWWLSKPESGKGLAVSGRPEEIRRSDNAQRNYHSAPARRRYAIREFHSIEIVKRHGCTTLETSDGFIVSLCGFINKSRTQQNGFPSEVCRDFIYGFPYNWEEYATSMGDESNQDSQRDMFNKKVQDDLIGMLSPQTVYGIETQPFQSTPSQVDADILTPKSKRTNSSMKRQRNGRIGFRDIIGVAVVVGAAAALLVGTADPEEQPFLLQPSIPQAFFFINLNLK